MSESLCPLCYQRPCDCHSDYSVSLSRAFHLHGRINTLAERVTNLEEAVAKAKNAKVNYHAIVTETGAHFFGSSPREEARLIVKDYLEELHDNNELARFAFQILTEEDD